ncbi:hypothetical protein ACFXA3_21500 [Streptomyces sp. NPDC059456]|uniref:hypothetical protein n=1 Tax=Streptomyces sp. NPDC059456 TaxID=3346838 RepID=UPI0036C7C023
MSDQPAEGEALVEALVERVRAVLTDPGFEEIATGSEGVHLPWFWWDCCRTSWSGCWR